jgi:hypothetical protein
MPSGGPPPRPSATSPPTSPSTRFASIEPTTAQPHAQFQLSACSALLGYLIVEVSQMEVLWPLAVSVVSPEVVSVMRPADFNSGIPFLTVFALPTLIFNCHRNTGPGQPAKRLDFLKHFLSFPTQPAAFSHFAQLHVSSSPYITIPFPRLNRAVLRPLAFQNPRELRSDRP